MIQSVVTQAKWGWTQSMTMCYFGLYTLNLVRSRSNMGRRAASGPWSGRGDGIAGERP